MSRGGASMIASAVEQLLDERSDDRERRREDGHHLAEWRPWILEDPELLEDDRLVVVGALELEQAVLVERVDRAHAGRHPAADRRQVAPLSGVRAADDHLEDHGVLRL